MKRIIISFTISFTLIALLSTMSLAATKSDYDHRYKLPDAKTWNFEARRNAANDSLGNNSLWERRIRRDVTEQLAAHGFTQANGAPPSLLVSYHLGTRERVQTQYVGTGFPGYVGRRGRWFGWGPGWSETTVWRTPYLKSTLVMDVIDAQTKQLVWRGYDTETIDFNKADQTINKAVEHLTKRFTHDLKVSEEK